MRRGHPPLADGPFVFSPLHLRNEMMNYLLQVVVTE